MKTNHRLPMLLSVLLLATGVQEASAFYNPQTGRWLSRDPIGEAGGSCLYGFVRNASIGTVDRNGLEPVDVPPILLPDYPPITIEPPPWLAQWNAIYDDLRDKEHFSPLKACEEANKRTGQNYACSSLGRTPEPKLYCGCNYNKVLQAADTLRQKGDGRPAGADKLAHCYAFCVTAAWGGPLAPLLNFFTGDSDPLDTEANTIGIRLGMALPPSASPCNCLKACASATRDMRFD